MAKTIRTILTYQHPDFNTGVIVKVDDTQSKWQKIPLSPSKEKRLRPYLKSGVLAWKYKCEGFNHNYRNNTQTSKDVVSAANRSMKKAARQELKQQLNNELAFLLPHL